MPYDVKIIDQNGKTVQEKINDLRELKDLLEKIKNFQQVNARRIESINNLHKR